MPLAKIHVVEGRYDETRIAGFVVPEKEIVRKVIALKPFKNEKGGPYVTADHNVQFPKGATGEGNFCIAVDLATVSKAHIFSDIDLMHYELGKNGVTSTFDVHLLPQVLWHSRKFIFQSD
jgi:hypothetical protein